MADLATFERYYKLADRLIEQSVDAIELNEEQLKLLVLGLENLVGVLGNVMSGLGKAKH